MSKQNNPFEGVPQQVWGDLAYEIDRHGLEFADNRRAYRRSDYFLFEQYTAAAESGCCGIFESTTRVDGYEWVIGCNYGH